MKKTILTLGILVAIVVTGFSQTLFVPGGAQWGVAGSGTGYIGIGTNMLYPQQELDIRGVTPNLQFRNTSESESGIMWKDEETSTEFGRILWNAGGNNEFDFYVNDATNPVMTLDKNKNVGIGNSYPTSKLHINTSGTVNGFKLSANPSTTWREGIIVDVSALTTATNRSTYRAFALQNDGTDIFRVDGDGTTHIESILYAQEIFVQTNVWPDYVFKKEYKLKSLYEVEQFIEANNHLPEIPAEEEILEGGINVSEMNVLLLQKIEELTLYTIEQQKNIDEMKRQIKDLSEKIK